MDFSPDHLAKVRSENGNFETDMLRRQFQTVLSNALAQAAATNGATALDPKPSRAEFRVISFGLYEIEKKRFSPYAHAKAKLTTASGKQVWSEQAYSVGLQVRPLEDYLRDAKLYRTDFEEIAADLAAQLVHGPIRNPPEL